MAIATITSFAPAVVPANGNTAAKPNTTVITGVGFTGTTAVTVNGSSATFTVTSDTSLLVTLPNNVAGVATVAVTNGSGTATDSSSLTISAYVVPTRNSVVSNTGVFDTSGTTRFTNNTADQYAFEENSLFGGTYSSGSYPQYLVRVAKIKAVSLFNKRYPAQAIAVPTF